MKRRDKAAEEGIETRKKEAERLEAERLEEERLAKEAAELENIPVKPAVEGEPKLGPIDKINAAIERRPTLRPPVEAGAHEGIKELNEALEEARGTPQKIVVPEGFEVTRLVYDADGEPTAVYIDRMSSLFTGDKVAAFVAGVLTGIFFVMAMRYLLPVAITSLLGAVGGL